jgi:lauroyl/myristoyl acyltransferase
VAGLARGRGLGPGRAAAATVGHARPLPGRAPRRQRPLTDSDIVDIAYLTYRVPAALVERLPAPLGDKAAAAIASTIAGLAPAGASPYLRHLERVLGRPLSPAEQRAWLRRAYRSYARYWMEGARLATLEPGVVEARMSVERGWGEFVDAMAKGNGVVLALPHVGSWEWGGAWLALRGYPMTSVAEQLGSQRLFQWFAEQRRRMGLTIVPLGPGAAPVLLETLRRGGLVGLLCDRDIAGGGVEVEFFGERTTLPAGPATLALRTGATLMAGAVYSGPGEHHTGVLLPPLDTERRAGLRADVARVTQAVARQLETLIRRAPDQWYLFQPNWPSDPGWRRGAA